MADWGFFRLVCLDSPLQREPSGFAPACGVGERQDVETKPKRNEAGFETMSEKPASGAAVRIR